MKSAVHGAPPPALALVPEGARQVSPLFPGAETLEDLADASLDEIVVAAPAGAIDRRYVLAQALRALKVGGRLVVTAPKDKGGLRLKKELAAFGCEAAVSARRHQRLCVCRRPPTTRGLDAAIDEGGPQVPPRLGLVSQPGVFSWDRPDPGSTLLARQVTRLRGRGADLGCGVGALALAVLQSPDVTELALIDIDRRAVAAARRNVSDPRATFVQADLRQGPPPLRDLDFVVMNPPFHLEGGEDRQLGVAFIRRAAEMLRAGGTCRLVANITLPYEATLREAFAGVRLLDQAEGYKLYEAIKG